MLIVKIGGGRAINVEGVAADLAGISGPVVIVHGANSWRDELAEKAVKYFERAKADFGEEVFRGDKMANVAISGKSWWLSQM